MGDREHHILLIEALAPRTEVRAAVARIDDDHGLGALDARGAGIVVARGDRPPGGAPAAGRRWRESSPRRSAPAQGQDAPRPPDCLQGVLLDANRLRGVDDDAGLARSEQPIAKGADQARSLLARSYRASGSRHRACRGRRGTGWPAWRCGRERGADRSSEKRVSAPSPETSACVATAVCCEVSLAPLAADGGAMAWPLASGSDLERLLGGDPGEATRRRRLGLADLGLPLAGRRLPELARLRRCDRRQKRPRRADGDDARPCVPGAQPRPVRRSHRSAPSLATVAMASLTGTFNHMLCHFEGCIAATVGQDHARTQPENAANLCEKAACLDFDNGLESDDAYSRNRVARGTARARRRVRSLMARHRGSVLMEGARRAFATDCESL